MTQLRTPALAPAMTTNNRAAVVALWPLAYAFWRTPVPPLA